MCKYSCKNEDADKPSVITRGETELTNVELIDDIVKLQGEVRLESEKKCRAQLGQTDAETRCAEAEFKAEALEEKLNEVLEESHILHMLHLTSAMYIGKLQVAMEHYYDQVEVEDESDD